MWSSERKGSRKQMCTCVIMFVGQTVFAPTGWWLWKSKVVGYYLRTINYACIHSGQHHYSCFTVSLKIRHNKRKTALPPFSLPPTGTPAIATAVQTLRTALISVTCVLGVMSILTFIIGFLFGNCFSQRRRKSSGKKDESLSNPTAEDLELKDNVVYITIHPK